MKKPMSCSALERICAVLSVLIAAGCAAPMRKINVTPLHADDSSNDLDSYERLTDEERGAFTPVAFDEALKLFDESGTGMVVYSADWCPYCQRALPVLADAALEAGAPVYYVSLSDGTTTEEQIDTLSRHLDWIEFAVAEDDQKEHAVSFQIPQVIAVKDGKAINHHVSLFDDLTVSSSDFELSDEQKVKLKAIYAAMFDALRDGAVSTDSAPSSSAAEGEACESANTGC